MRSRKHHGRREEAFATYVGMGDSRSLAKLAKALGVGLATVKKYSKEGRWQERVAAIESESEKRFQEITAEQTAQIRVDQLNEVRAAQEVVARRMRSKAFGTRVGTKDTVATYKELVLLDRLLTGETTENHGHTTSHEDALSELE